VFHPSSEKVIIRPNHQQQYHVKSSANCKVAMINVKSRIVKKNAQKKAEPALYCGCDHLLFFPCARTSPAKRPKSQKVHIIF